MLLCRIEQNQKKMMECYNDGTPRLKAGLKIALGTYMSSNINPNEAHKLNCCQIRTMIS